MKMAQIDIKNKNNVFLTLNFKDNSQLCYKIYNKIIFMQYVCKSAHKLVFPLNTVYIICILMSCCWDGMLKKINVIMGVIIFQIFLIISNIS